VIISPSAEAPTLGRMNDLSEAILTPQQQLYHTVVGALHGWHSKNPKDHWEPHEGQALIGKAVFVNNIKFIFVQCGRKWGKTEIILYILWRWALLNPGNSCYYICPSLKQAKEIVWKSKDRRGRSRVQEFGPKEFVEGIDNQELRVIFKNGSFIKVDGSDNFDNWAGISPHLVVEDEIRSFRAEFHAVMNPNRAVFDAPLIAIGTPPEQIWLDRDTPHPYVELAHEARDLMMEDGSAFWIKRPSWDNPDPIIQKWLAREKIRLIRKNREYEWMREYGAELVPGSANKVFPTFVADMTLPHPSVIGHDYMVNALNGYN